MYTKHYKILKFWGIYIKLKVGFSIIYFTATTQ